MINKTILQDFQNQNQPVAPESAVPPKKRAWLVVFAGFLIVSLVVGVCFYFRNAGGGMFQGRFFTLPSRGNVEKLSGPIIPEPYTGEPMKVYTSEPAAVETVPVIEESMREFTTQGILSGSAAVSETDCFTDADYSDIKAPITRAHFAKMLTDFAGIDAAGFVESSFVDVSSVDSCSKYIETLTAQGIVTPYFDGTFHPEKAMKRYEVAVWVVKAFGIPFALVEGGPTFPDVPANASYSPYVEALNSWNAVLLTKGETEFRPNDDAAFFWAQSVSQIAKFFKAFSRVY